MKLTIISCHKSLLANEKTPQYILLIFYNLLSILQGHFNLSSDILKPSILTSYSRCRFD
jgi:hypothetical protein